MVSPVNKSPTSRGVRNPQGIQHGTRRKAKNSRIQEAPHCGRNTTSQGHPGIPTTLRDSPGLGVLAAACPKLSLQVRPHQPLPDTRPALGNHNSTPTEA